MLRKCGEHHGPTAAETAKSRSPSSVSPPLPSLALCLSPALPIGETRLLVRTRGTSRRRRPQTACRVMMDAPFHVDRGARSRRSPSALIAQGRPLSGAALCLSFPLSRRGLDLGLTLGVCEFESEWRQRAGRWKAKRPENEKARDRSLSLSLTSSLPPPLLSHSTFPLKTAVPQDHHHQEEARARREAEPADPAVDPLPHREQDQVQRQAPPLEAHQARVLEESRRGKRGGKKRGGGDERERERVFSLLSLLSPRRRPSSSSAFFLFLLRARFL